MHCPLIIFELYSTLNFENLHFENETFDHVNCQGVVHHTPNTQKAINEIFRVLKRGGKASISVYYKNFLLRNYNYLYPVIKILIKYYYFCAVHLNPSKNEIPMTFQKSYK